MILFLTISGIWMVDWLGFFLVVGWDLLMQEIGFQCWVVEHLLPPSMEHLAMVSETAKNRKNSKIISNQKSRPEYFLWYNTMQILEYEI